jgi:choline dehydrogenase-like flavoprotein
MIDADIIVVGSGPAGVSAAWPLVRAGLKVMMIDASQGQDVKPTGDWSDSFGRDLGALADSDTISPKFGTSLAQSVLAGFAARNHLATKNFFAAGSLAQGGLSKIWGALVETFDAEELAGFPFEAAALAPSYAAIKARIGVTRESKDTLASAPARLVFGRHLRQGDDRIFELRAATNAVLSQDKDGRAACTRCGGCLFGCSLGSIYDSADELPALGRFSNFTYAADHFVHSLAKDGPIHVLDVEVAGVRRQLRAAAVVLAAGTIATTRLVLGSLGWFDRPVRLLTNPAAAIAFVVPRFIGNARPDRSFSLGQLFYRLRDTASAAGVIYGADALPLDLFAARLPLTRPAALRLAQVLTPALLVSSLYLPGSFSRNFLFAHREAAGHRLRIDGIATEEAQAALRNALKRLQRQMRGLGAFALPGSISVLPPGGDAHYAGTLPMAGAGALATTPDGELKDRENLFIVDGSVLPHLPATHLTLTIMANADRIGEAIARRFSAADAAKHRDALRRSA